MSLLNNYSVLNSSPGRAIGNFNNLYSKYKPSSWYSYYIPDTDTVSLLKRASIFTGTEPPYAWILAIKGGEMSCSNTMNGSSTLTSGMISGAFMTTTLDGVGTLTAGLSIRIQLAATLTGTATLVGNVSARIAMSATLAGTSVLTSGLSLTVRMASTMDGSSSLVANLKGIARMEAQIFVNQSEATVQEIVSGVWNAVTANYDEAGTMGEVMNNMGAVADPWSTLLPGSYTTGQAGKILGDLLSNIPDSVWDELKTSHTTTDSFGKLVQDIDKLAKQIKALTAAGL
jgi:hypothetical protein